MGSDVLLVGGNIFGHLPKKRHDLAGILRTQLLESGASYVICLFDGSFNRQIHQTPRMTVEFYESVVKWVLSTPSAGLVIKPKGKVPRSLDRIGALVDQAIAEGRCVVLDAKVSSFEAANSADIAIGLGINTAGLDAAIAGVPAVHFDLPGMAKAYDGLVSGFEQFVFSDAGELFAAVETHMESGGKTALGDHGSWLDSVDPFQDGGAARRLGTYLRWFLESVEAGRESQHALADANKRYSREVGPQYVMDAQGQVATANGAGHQ